VVNISTRSFLSNDPSSLSMKILEKKLKEGIVSFRIDSLDDLWFLSHIIEAGDRIKGETERKVRLGTKETAVRKKFNLTIEVEKLDYTATVLRANGKIVDGPEDIERGAYQSFSFEQGTIASIIKESWSKYHLKKLDDATKGKSKILILALDRDESCYALLKAQGYEVLSTKTAENLGKQYAVEQKDFFKDVLSHINNYVQRFSIEQVIIACPSIWRKNIEERLPETKIKINFIDAGGGSQNTIVEVLRREELKQFLAEDQSAAHMRAVEAILKEIATTKKSTYGFSHVKAAVKQGACEILLISESFLQKAKEDGK